MTVTEHETPTRGRTEQVLSLAGINKRFGAVQALTDVSLDVHAGEVLALVGDNGAGKSTLVKTIAGVYQADSGAITLGGEQVTIPTPSAAQHLGIATVFQDLALCDNLDVVANLFLGKEHHLGPVMNEISMEKEAWRLLRSLSAKIPSVRIPWPRSPEASGRRSPSPARSWATRGSSCSTSRPLPSVSPRPPRCSTSSSGCGTTASA